MKKIILILVLFFASFAILNAQESVAPTFNLTIEISGFNTNKGQVLIGLYNTKEGFLKQHFKEGMAKIANQKATFLFTNLPKGEYAVSVLHDENNNNKMDTNFLGIPKEDYGCSNNAKGFMGPPSYKDAKFNLIANDVIKISI